MGEQTHPDVHDVQTLLRQVHAGVLLAIDHLNRDFPYVWGQRKPRRGPHEAWLYTYRQLSTTWINLGHWLIKQGVPAWSIAALPQPDADGTVSLMEFGPGGAIELTPGMALDLSPRDTPREAVRVVAVPSRPAPVESRYTLDEARELLAAAGELHRHDWGVELRDGEPAAVVCRDAACGERRPLPEVPTGASRSSSPARSR